MNDWWDQWQRQLKAAQQDVEADGHEWDQVAHDVILNLAWDWPADRRAEILRTELGLLTTRPVTQAPARVSSTPVTPSQEAVARVRAWREQTGRRKH